MTPHDSQILCNRCVTDHDPQIYRPAHICHLDECVAKVDHASHDADDHRSAVPCETSVPRCTGGVDGVSGRRAQRLNRPSSTPGVHAEAAVRYTPTVVTTLLLLIAALTVVAASLLVPSRWFGRVERWAFWRRKSVRERVRGRHHGQGG